MDSNNDIPSQLLHVPVVHLTQEDLDKINYFKNTLLANQSVAQGMHYFQMAYFMLKMINLPEVEFNRVCHVARHMAAQGCSNFNAALNDIPKHVLEIGQKLGNLPSHADAIDVMRGVSEAQQQLLDARKYTNGHTY